MNQKTKQKKTLLSETHVWAFFLRIHHIYIYMLAAYFLVGFI